MRINYVAKLYGKILHIYDHVYRENIWVLVSKDEKDYIKLYKKWFEELPPEGLIYDCIAARYSYGTAKDKKGKFPVHIIWLKEIDIPALCHEIAHCTASILGKKSIPLCEDTDEAYAYHQEFLMKTILNAFGGKKCS